MERHYILNVDIGTSSCKVVLFNEEGQLLCSASREHITRFGAEGAAEQEPAEWWRGSTAAIKEMLEKSGISNKEIAVIGVDSQSSAMIPMTRSGQVLHPAMIWTDRRARAEKNWIDKYIGQQRISEINGNHNDESNVALKLMWFRDHRAELYKRTDIVLNAAGYLVYKLTGCFSTNISEGGLTQMFDTEKGIWSEELIKAYGLHREKLPDIYPCSQVVGTLTAKSAAMTGLAEGTRVVAGAMDAVACGLGCGMVLPGDSFITGGTVTALGTCSARPVKSDSFHVYHHIVPGTWCNMAGVDYGGGNFRWFRDQFMPDCENREVYDEMNRLAAEAGPGADKLLFLPTLVGQRCPQWDGSLRGAFVGISPRHTKGHFIRALMEGNVFAIKEIMELQVQQGLAAQEITIAGGIANSDLWMQIFAEALNIPLYKAECEEAASVGSMMNAAYGIGILSSFAAGKKRLKARRVEQSEANQERYERLFRVYKTLYPSLKKTFRELEQLEL